MAFLPLPLSLLSPGDIPKLGMQAPFCITAPSMRIYHTPWPTPLSSQPIIEIANCLCFEAYQEVASLQRARHQVLYMGRSHIVRGPAVGSGSDGAICQLRKKTGGHDHMQGQLNMSDTEMSLNIDNITITSQ